MSRAWYLTRKFPPSVGGMQNLSFHIASQLARSGELRVLSWGGTTWGLPWFALRAGAQLLWGLLRGDVRVLLLGDPALAVFGSLAKAFRVPVAVVVHGLDITYPAAWYQAYLRLLFWRRFDAYVCISRHVANLVQARQVPPERIHLIHPGVDESGAVQPPRDSDAIRLLLLGRLVPRKGALWFVSEVLPALVQRLPGLHLDIVGDGPGRAAIAMAVDRLALGQHVTLHGSVSTERKAAITRDAHAMVVPNLPTADDPEGFGLVALEGAAAGKYVFAADIDGLRDAVHDPATGRLVRAADAPAWIETLAQECRDREQLLELGLRASRYVAEGGFGWEQMGTRYRQVLDALA